MNRGYLFLVFLLNFFVAKNFSFFLCFRKFNCGIIIELNFSRTGHDKCTYAKLSFITTTLHNFQSYFFYDNRDDRKSLKNEAEQKLITFFFFLYPFLSAVIDGVDTAGMSREQLEAFCVKLRNELEREREERNFFQIERDKLRTFWEITRKQYEDSQGTIRNKEREVEMAQEMADLDTKNVMQQMKHLQYENQSKIGEMRAEMMTQLKLAQEDHAIQERELFNDIRDLKKLCREKDEFNELQIQQIKMKHSEILSLEREKFQNETKEMSDLHERRLQEYMENSEIRHRMEMSEVEERKNHQIRQLIDCHEKAFGEMKSYYNDITINNLALISSIKEQMEEMRRQTERNEKQMADAHSGETQFYFLFETLRFMKYIFSRTNSKHF